jgi:hypothetical protein
MTEATDANKAAIAFQVRKDELLKKLSADPIAFLRQLANAHVQDGRKPEPGTHLLTWNRGGLRDKNLYIQEVLDELVEYIFMLEDQLAIDAAQFRQKSINTIIQNHHLDGFTKVQS